MQSITRDFEHADVRRPATVTHGAKVYAGAAAMLVAALALTTTATAQEPAKQGAGAGPLLITLGSNAVYAPRFEGSSRHDVGPWPIISWRRQGDKEWLDHPTDGIDYSLIETSNFRLGPVGYFRWQRDNATIPMRGFSRVGSGKSSIDLSVEGGMFAEYWPTQWLRGRVEMRETLMGGSGLLAILASDVVWKPDAAWTVAVGPRLTLADRRFMESYYGVNAAQSASTGLATYAPGAGIRSYGVGAMARYKISQAWTTQIFADYQHLTGPAGDSPVIATRGTPEQYLVGAGLSYTFVAPWER